MKKLIAITLIAIMVLGLAACGTINKSEVSVLWSGDGIVKVPNSLINAMERAMYIENISYKHYGANGDQATQTKQATDALNAGCAALIVELVDVIAAQEIVDAAKAKNVPVVFFNCEVDESIISGYNKAACVISDTASIGEVQGKQISEAVIKKNDPFILMKLFGAKTTYSIHSDYDRNKDGKISYLAFGDATAAIDAVNTALTEQSLPTMEAIAETSDISLLVNLTVIEGEKAKDLAQLTTADGASVELIITDSDTTALDVLLALQAHGFNSTKLTTHRIPVYTVGNDMDYKEYAMKTMPAAPHALDTVDKAEMKAMDEWWKSDAVAEWKTANATVCSPNSVDWSDLNVYLYTTTDVIGAGRLTGTAMVDYDTIATTVASLVSDLLAGGSVQTQVNKIPYTTN